MNEELRKLALEKIKTFKDERERVISLQNEMNELLNNDIVKRYLYLEKEVSNVNVNSDKKLMLDAFNSLIRNIKCNHDFWVYLGSFYYVDDMFRSYSVRVPDESDKKFEYNLYGCLECDETIEVSDYLKFESEHLCLKKKSFVNIYELRGLYFKYLTEMKTSEAMKKLKKLYGGKE